MVAGRASGLRGRWGRGHGLGLRGRRRGGHGLGLRGPAAWRAGLGLRPRSRGSAAPAPARWPLSPAGPPRAQRPGLRGHRRGRCFRAAEQFDPGDRDADDGQAHCRGPPARARVGAGSGPEHLVLPRPAARHRAPSSPRRSARSPGRRATGVTAPRLTHVRRFVRVASPATRFVLVAEPAALGGDHVRRLRVGVGGRSDVPAVAEPRAGGAGGGDRTLDAMARASGVTGVGRRGWPAASACRTDGRGWCRTDGAGACRSGATERAPAGSRMATARRRAAERHRHTEAFRLDAVNPGVRRQA